MEENNRQEQPSVGETIEVSSISSPTPPTAQPPEAASVSAPQPGRRAESVKSPKKPKSGKTFKFWPTLLIGLAIIVVIIAGWIYLSTHSKTVNENTNVNQQEFQAVFLTNGQVYFGKLTDLNNKYIKLTDIYYLQVQQGQSQNLQEGKTSKGDKAAQVSLSKLGNELHGPEDQMYVASDQVLFWENLKPNGKVTKAIDNYQSKQ